MSQFTPPPLPALAGSQEAAIILGVEVPRITRLRRDDRMPPPVARTAATWVWRADDVLLLAGTKDRRWPQDAPPVPTFELIGLAEVALVLAVHKRQVSRWRDAGVLPAPALEKRDVNDPWNPADPERRGLAATPLYWRPEIRTFARLRKRKRAAAS